MSTNAQPIDYFAINTTKIYSANPAGNFTVTSLPLTSRHLQDIESPSHYNLLFDLVASSFSKIPLHRRSLQQFSPSPKASNRRPRLHQRTLSTTRSAEPILALQQHKHQQSRAGPKTATSKSIRIPADATGARPSRARSCNSLYESQTHIEARSAGAFLTLPEHGTHCQAREIPRRTPRLILRQAEAVLPIRHTVLNSSHQPRLNSSRSADPILRPRSTRAQQRTTDHCRPPQFMSGSSPDSTSAEPSRVMAPGHIHSLDLDGCGPFPSIGSPRRQTTAQPPKRSFFFSFLHTKKAANASHRAQEDGHEVRRHQRHERAAEKMAKENADVSWRIEREQRERMQNIKKLEKAAEMKAQRIEEHVAKMEIRRHQKEMGGVSCGYDPWAGTMPHATKGPVKGREHRDVSDRTASQDGEDEESGPHRAQRGTTWGISSGTPGRTGGYYGSDGSAS